MNMNETPQFEIKGNHFSASSKRQRKQQQLDMPRQPQDQMITRSKNSNLFNGLDIQRREKDHVIKPIRQSD
jgi:hypothetical protein